MATSLQSAAEDIAKKNQVVPLTNDFDETKSTAGRVASITDQNSPLMQRAAVTGTQTAAARGLTNSSLAAEASQNAVLGAATPIAQTDASLYSQNSLANLAAKNAAATTNANNATSLGNTALTGESQAALQQDALTNSNLQQDKSLAQQAQQFGVQANQSQQQIDSQIAQFAQSLGVSTADLAIRRDTLTQQQQQFLANLEQQKAAAQLQADTSVKTATISSDTQKAIASLSRDSQLQIAQLQAANQADIQGNMNIGNAWSATMTNIANIQNNPNLEQAAKQTLIQNNIDSFQSYTNFWKKLGSSGGADVTDLLNFNTTNATTSSGSAGAAPVNPTVPGGDYGNTNYGGGGA